MKLFARRPLLATAVLCFVWLMHMADGVALAQSDGQDRSARIKEQMGLNGTRMASEADLTELRNNLNKAMEAIVSRIGALEKDMIDMKSRIRVLEARTAPAASTLTPPVSSPAGSPAPSQPAPAPSGPRMNVSMCASGCDANKFSAAVALVAEGGTLTVEPGDYFDCVVIRKSMKLVGKVGADGSRAHLKKIACEGKGAVDMAAPDITVTGLKISGITVPDQNGACFRVERPSRNILIKDVICLDSEDGLLGGVADDDGVMTIEDSLFSGNGKGGQAHDIYINGGANAILRNVKILAADNGHLLKTGARSILVENSIIAALGGNSGAAIDAYGGGKLTVRKSVLQLGPNTQNHNFLAYADEPNRIVPGGVHEINFENNWIIYDDPNRCCRWLFSRRSNILDKVDMRNNKFVGMIDPIFVSVDMRLNKEYKNREAAGLPKYDGTVESMPKPGS